MSIAIYRSTLFPASGGESNRERNEYRRYFLLHYYYHPPFNEQARDRLLVVRRAIFYLDCYLRNLSRSKK